MEFNEMKEIRYGGMRYKAVVPDTLDFTERAELAINALGGIIDRETSHSQYFTIDYARKVPALKHDGGDYVCDPKWTESMMLMRIMSGSYRHVELQEAQRREIMGRIRDGLYWNYVDASRPWRLSYSPMYDYRRNGRPEEDMCPVGAVGRVLRTLVVNYELNSDPFIKGKIRELIAGLKAVAVYKDDYCYFPDGGYGEPFNYPKSGWITTDEPKTEVEGGEGAVTCFMAASVYSLTKWYNLSGDTEALELAEKLVRFCMLPKFWGGMVGVESMPKEQESLGLWGGMGGVDPGMDCDDPREKEMKVVVVPSPYGIAGHELGHWYSHFHTRGITLRAILEFGIATDDFRMKEFVRRAYEFSLTNGIARTGWICSAPNPFGNNFMEGCNLGDIIALAIRLSDAGMGDYWDDVDAVARNQLAEAQFTNADLLRKVAESTPAENIQPYEDKLKDDASYSSNYVTYDNVIERTLGSFAAWSQPAGVENVWSAGCCNANATQGIYYVWEGSLREYDGHAQVNLLLNRSSKSLDVDSHLPHEGKVVLHNKSNDWISVRIPSWVPRNEVIAQMNGCRILFSWVGGYMLLAGLKPGDDITIGFPVRETTASYTAAYRTKEQRTYECTFRGSTLVDISPRDSRTSSYPFYMRDHMRRDKAGMKEIERFVPDRIIPGWIW